MNRILPWLLLPALAPALPAASPADRFEEANILYEQGRYEEASGSYRQLIEELRAQGKDSAAARFNLANALQRDSRKGEALIQYRKALQLAPRDADIRTNLRLLEEQLGPASRFPQGWTGRLSLILALDQWTLIAMACFWCGLLLHAASRFAPAPWRSRLGRASQAAGVCFAAACCLLLLALRERHGSDYGVVTHPQAVVRFGPYQESESSYNLEDGARVRLVEKKGEWQRIEDPQARGGWLLRERIGDLPPLP